MKTYPRLAEMGVLHPQQIAKFSVNSIAYTDILRIVYERPKGSILPASKTFKFPRIQKSVAAGSDADKTDVVMESDPGLRAALEELQDLTQAKAHKRDVASAILEELRLLEEDIALRSEYIKTLVGEINTG